MSLKFALLGYLSTAPASGYEIAAEFGSSLGWFWSASHSQIYPELRRLEAGGLIVAEEQKIGSRGKRRVYTLTEQGTRALRAWVAKPVVFAPTRDVERLKLMFLDRQAPAMIRAHLEAQASGFEAAVEHWEDQVRMVEAGEHPRLVARLKNKSTREASLIIFLVGLATRGQLDRARLEVRWAREAIEALESLPTFPTRT